MARLFGRAKTGAAAGTPAPAGTPAERILAERILAERILAQAAALAARPSLPSKAALRDLIEGAYAALRSEAPGLRPRDSSGEPGGLLRLPPLPTVLLPDIHARPSLLAETLAWEGPSDAPFGAPLARLLGEGRATLLCLGDLFHTEWEGAPRRWERALREYLGGYAGHRWMDEEMALALSSLRIVLAAKAAFPGFFHFIKGNHDNISNDEERGDRPFYKFAAEGEMVTAWFDLAYGPELRARLRQVELEYPVLAVGSNFVASHGEPAFALAPSDVIEYRRRPDVVYGLIWTPNDGAEEGSVERSLEALLGAPTAGEKGPGAKGALWFGGHRPVEGRYALRAHGRYVQFHNPGAHQAALLEPGRDPDPERDIRTLSRPK
ncbi:MAG TPA: hypothetical protein VMV90_13100 [Rectinemataceae bacterium]|nr:hypothetical protein [Rectinemataceae bacterium]